MSRTSDIRRRWWIIMAMVVAIAVGGVTYLGLRDGTTARQYAAAARGAQVMPFDLERTTHRFTKNRTGGEQTVVADDPSDTEQIRLIRQHLAKENAKFSRGDFSAPETIHGSRRAGLAELAAGYRRVTTEYADTASGGHITYTADDPALVTALHGWFDAQVSDHGGHAESGG
ncbi:hypothetical protein [Qaidamihabitans albus]|uniref:hypothetical protein n=1 Tax=Qaidamihabitans albus TaxID=2795733 RepID=UPI0018F2222A|nr:hypothetical protein [Qaidamihabitans albus]